jgi:hypothetical protein
MLFGLADHQVQEIVEFYATREAAEETLRQILADEPGWIDILKVVEIDLAGMSMNRRHPGAAVIPLGWLEPCKETQPGAAR